MIEEPLDDVLPAIGAHALYAASDGEDTAEVRLDARPGGISINSEVDGGHQAPRRHPSDRDSLE
ncbi:MAG: hypothetical protein Kow00122_10850 [Thermoleophilia bacterium]